MTRVPVIVVIQQLQTNHRLSAKFLLRRGFVEPVLKVRKSLKDRMEIATVHWSCWSSYYVINSLIQLVIHSNYTTRSYSTISQLSRSKPQSRCLLDILPFELPFSFISHLHRCWRGQDKFLTIAYKRLQLQLCDDVDKLCVPKHEESQWTKESSHCHNVTMSEFSFQKTWRVTMKGRCKSPKMQNSWAGTVTFEISRFFCNRCMWRNGKIQKKQNFTKM